MKKLSLLFQWCVVIAGVAALVHALWTDRPLPEHHPDSWESRRGFHALSFEGVATGDPRYISTEKLAECLLALQQAGWRCITDEDALRFLRENAPLPEKALLLLFEGGRRDHLIRATPLLHEAGFIGHLAMPTSLAREWGNHYLKSIDIQRMARLPHWRIVSMGHEAIRTLPQGGNFLSHRRPGEDDSSYRARVADDFLRAAVLLSRWTGRTPVTYLFPYADTGDTAGADPLASSLLVAEAGRWHGIAFSNEGFSFNGPDRDPLRLTRIRVRGDSNLADLVARLEAPPPTADQEIDLEVRVPEGGVAHLFLRHQGPQAHLRLSFVRGRVRVSEKHGGALVTLAELPLPPDPPPLRVLLKRNRLRIDLDGRPLAPAVSLRVLAAGEHFHELSGGASLVSTVHPLRAHPHTVDSLAESATLDLDPVSILFFPLSDDPPEQHLADWIRLSAAGVEPVPLLSDPQHLEFLLAARSRHPALESLVSAVALPGDQPDALARAKGAGLSVYALVGPESPPPRIGNGVRPVFRDAESGRVFLHPDEEGPP